VLIAEDGRVGGDHNHPANRGRLCSKGAALGETLATDGRLLHPQIGGRRASWDDALQLIADRFLCTIATHGPEAVAFFVSGQFLTEDYYVANKLMKGFIGSGNIDSNSRLCMASSVAGHIRAFGEDIVPGCYDDIEAADLVVLVGSNMAWCHPVLYQRLVAAKEKHQTHIVVIDPRRTPTCDIADLHLALGRARMSRSSPGCSSIWSTTERPTVCGWRNIRTDLRQRSKRHDSARRHWRRLPRWPICRWRISGGSTIGSPRPRTL
jgi:assimilatory nitrate reductase catalytic subunit